MQKPPSKVPAIKKTNNIMNTPGKKALVSSVLFHKTKAYYIYYIIFYNCCFIEDIKLIKNMLN